MLTHTMCSRARLLAKTTYSSCQSSARFSGTVTNLLGCAKQVWSCAQLRPGPASGTARAALGLKSRDGRVTALPSATVDTGQTAAAAVSHTVGNVCSDFAGTRAGTGVTLWQALEPVHAHAGTTAAH